MWTVVNIPEGSEKETGVCGVVVGGRRKWRSVRFDQMFRLESEWLIELAIKAGGVWVAKKKKIKGENGLDWQTM